MFFIKRAAALEVFFRCASTACSHYANRTIPAGLMKGYFAPNDKQNTRRSSKIKIARAPREMRSRCGAPPFDNYHGGQVLVEHPRMYIIKIWALVYYGD